MRRVGLLGVGTALLGAMLLQDFGAVLFRGRQFGYRDAAQHYYPLYLRVQQEWDAGRWPLWNPWENGGMPLLGNPTAAVFYPGKILYAFLPYPWATRLYVVSHVALAFFGMLLLSRGWGIGGSGAILSSLSYAFGAPVLFQYSNVIYLVGAAWLPLGLRATDRWIRMGCRSAPIVLAVILALQILGGDPQTALLTILCGLGYGIGLHRTGRSESRPTSVGRRLVYLLFGIGVWTVSSLLIVAVLPRWRAFEANLPRWTPSRPLVGVLCWSLALVWIWKRSRARDHRRTLASRLFGLAGAGLFAIMLSAVQMVPAAELALKSTRAHDRATPDLDSYSLVPYRTIEMIWPNVFGSRFPENHSWIYTLEPRDDQTFWVPSLYLGGLSIVLALGSTCVGPARQPMRWLLSIGIISLVAAFGQYAGPKGAMRWIPAIIPGLPASEPTNAGGPSAPSAALDGDGSPYWLLSTVVPGFDLFRYPSKLLTFTSLAVSALAGFGWDQLTMGRRRRVFILTALFLIVGIVALGRVVHQKEAILATWKQSARSSPEAGPLQPTKAFEELVRSLIHGSLVFGTTGLLAWKASRRPRRCGALAIVLLAADLAQANAPLVWTVPQSVYETPPRVLKVIQESEQRDPAAGPFRIHRMPVWFPFDWYRSSSPERLEEMVAWERDTLMPLHGLPLGLSYTMTRGVIEIDSYLRMFVPMRIPVPPAMAEFLGVRPGGPVVYHPRRAYDLWNTRYFVLPTEALGWRDENRGYASFLEGVAMMAPALESLGTPEEKSRWYQREDWQVFKNKAAFPRAWIVHDARVVPPYESLSTGRERSARLKALLYQADGIWNEPGRPVIDLRKTAWIESENSELVDLDRFLAPTQGSESVRITHYDPLRVELEASLASPGLVILAETFDSGWRLTIDGRSAPILKANHMMRAAAVAQGRHRLVYRYDPWTFRVGAWISLTALGLLAGYCLCEAWIARVGKRGERLSVSGASDRPSPEEPR